MSDLFGNHIVGFPTRWLISVKKHYQRQSFKVLLTPKKLLTDWTEKLLAVMLGHNQTKPNLIPYNFNVGIFVHFKEVLLRRAFSLKLRLYGRQNSQITNMGLN